MVPAVRDIAIMAPLGGAGIVKYARKRLTVGELHLLDRAGHCGGIHHFLIAELARSHCTLLTNEKTASCGHDPTKEGWGLWLTPFGKGSRHTRNRLLLARLPSFVNSGLVRFLALAKGAARFYCITNRADCQYPVRD